MLFTFQLLILTLLLTSNCLSYFIKVNNYHTNLRSSTILRSVDPQSNWLSYLQILNDALALHTWIIIIMSVIILNYHLIIEIHRLTPNSYLCCDNGWEDIHSVGGSRRYLRRDLFSQAIVIYDVCPSNKKRIPSAQDADVIANLNALIGLEMQYNVWFLFVLGLMVDW